MANVRGGFSHETASNSFLTERQTTWLEIALLVGSGALVVALHQAFRFPMQLPGRHGLEWMAILVVARAVSRQRWAGTLNGVGAAAVSLLPVWGVADDPFMPLIYFLPGLLADLVWMALPKWQANIAFLALLAGLAHATKPLSRFVINLVTGWPYGSLLNGVLYPLATHILFGIVGGLIGAGVVLGARRRKR